MATTVRSYVSLESGDRLTRDEFHHRYCARPDIRKAELVKGVVYVPSPARVESHGEPHGDVGTWLGTYKAYTPGVRLAIEATVFLTEDTEVQPDACLFRPSSEGAVRITDKDYIEGAPDLVVEAAASSAAYDLHDKMDAYREAGVPEHVVWKVLDKDIAWFRLQDGAYVRVQPDESGMIESSVFPGLRLAVAKMLAGDLAGVLAELAQGQPPSSTGTQSGAV